MSTFHIILTWVGPVFPLVATLPYIGSEVHADTELRGEDFGGGAASILEGSRGEITEVSLSLGPKGADLKLTVVFEGKITYVETVSLTYAQMQSGICKMDFSSLGCK